jgi:hypothetical protein
MDQWSLMKVIARERGWHKDNKDSHRKVQVNDEDEWAEILTQDFFKMPCPYFLGFNFFSQGGVGESPSRRRHICSALCSVTL